MCQFRLKLLIGETNPPLGGPAAAREVAVKLVKQVGGAGSGGLSQDEAAASSLTCYTMV